MAKDQDPIMNTEGNWQSTEIRMQDPSRPRAAHPREGRNYADENDALAAESMNQGLRAVEGIMQGNRVSRPVAEAAYNNDFHSVNNDDLEAKLIRSGAQAVDALTSAERQRIRNIALDNGQMPTDGYIRAYAAAEAIIAEARSSGIRISESDTASMSSISANIAREHNGHGGRF